MKEINSPDSGAGNRAKGAETARIAQLGLLAALALILSYIESLFPVFYAVPGMKLGLTNLVVLIALYHLSEGGAGMINLVRILISGFLFGNGAGILYSLAGGLISLAVMIVLKRTKKFGMTAVSAAGGIAHNAGQLLVAAVLLPGTPLVWYFIVLWFTGLSAGLVIGLLGSLLCRRLF